MGKAHSKFAKDLPPASPDIVRDVLHGKIVPLTVDPRLPRLFETSLQYYTEMINDSLHKGAVEGVILPKPNKTSKDYFRVTQTDIFVLKRIFATRGFLDVNIYNDVSEEKGPCLVYQVTLPRQGV
jgi:hypothetical protein